MALLYQENGQLIPGIHKIDWALFVKEYGYNPHRSQLIIGLNMALADLKNVGCKTVYIDGSFVTKKDDPGDYDACWEHEGVDLQKLKNEYPLFFDFTDGRANQKAHYKGELFPGRAPAKFNPIVYYFDFFQLDKEDNNKGIICLSL
jgi:hypothetical protein